MYKFGPYRLDLNNFNLTRKGEDIEVEPQVFKTLSMLVKNRERVVTKNELLEEVWQGRVVTDQVITRIIYELRKIFGDKTGHSEYIRTVRGQGYQFVAEVVEESQVDQKKLVKKADSTSDNPKRLLNKKQLIVVLMTSVVLMSGIFFWFNQLNAPSDSASEKPLQQQQSEYPIIALMPIAVEAGNEELSMLVHSLIEYLSNQLVVNLNMKVIHPDNLKHMGDQLDNMWSIQKATHSDFIIKGFVESETENNAKLHLSLYKSNQEGELTPFSLGAFEFPYPQNSEDLNELYKQRKVTIRSIVNIIKPGVKLKDNGDFNSDDPEAYRLVIAAHHISRTDDCKDMQRAENLLLEAVERDDGFVYAYLQLFSNYYKRVWICGESVEYHQKGLEMAKIIDRLAPNSYKAVAIRRSTILVESNQVENAYEFSKNADWNDPDSIYDKSYSLRYAGFLNVASKNLDRILQLDPFFFNDKPIEQAPNTLLYQNRFKEHLALLAEPGNSYHDYFRGLNLYFNNKNHEAVDVLQGVVERTPDDLFGQYSQALLWVIKKDYPNAIKVIDTISRNRNDKNHTDGEMTYKLVQLYALANASELALKYLQLTVDQGFFPVNYFLIDPALDSIQNDSIFHDIISQATIRHEAFAKRFNLEPETEADSNIE